MSAAHRESRPPAVDDTPTVKPPPADGEPGGARLVWLAAGVVGAIFVALLLWQLLLPRAQVTGSNSVGVRSAVGTLSEGQRLCVPGLEVPDGTGGLRFAAFGDLRPSLSAELRIGGQRLSAPAQLVEGPGRINVEAFFDETVGSAGGAAATACLTAEEGVVEIGGMAGLQGDQQPSRLDGRRFDNRVAVWFLPPAGEKRSLIASLPDIFERAALFRPGIVGPWTYPLLLFLVLPLTWFAGLRLLAAGAAGRRSRVAPALVIALVAFANAGAWALITPAFQAPDEPDHVAYAQHLAETGHQPQQGPGDNVAFSTDLTYALDGMRTYSVVGIADARVPWTPADEAYWKALRASTPHPGDNGGGFTTAAAPHHPPYYLLLAPAYLAMESSSPYSQVTAMRLVSALLGMLVALAAYGIVRELLPRRRVAAAAAGLLVGLHPMFTFMAGAINNDNGVSAAAAVTLYLVVRGLRRGPSWRLMLALGLMVALTPLMKGTGLAIYPAVAVGLLGMLWRHHGRADLPGWATLAGAFVALRALWSAIGPGFQEAGATGGGISASTSISGAIDQPFGYLSYLWQFFLPRLPFMQDKFIQTWPAFDIYVVQAWGAFGWATFGFPRWVYGTIVGVMAIAALLGIATLVRERVTALRLGWELVVIALVPICVIVAVEAAYFAPGGRPVLAEQGRYIFPAIAALATLAVGATFGLGRRWHTVLATAFVVALIGFGYASRFLAISSFYT